MTSKKTGYLLGALAGAGIVTAAMAGAGMQLPSAKADEAHLIKASTSPIFAPPPARRCHLLISSKPCLQRW